MSRRQLELAETRVKIQHSGNLTLTAMDSHEKVKRFLNSN